MERGRRDAARLGIVSSVYVLMNVAYLLAGADCLLI